MTIVVEDVFGATFGHVVNGCVWRGSAGPIVDLSLPVPVYSVLELKPATFCLGTIHRNIQKPEMGSISSNRILF